MYDCDRIVLLPAVFVRLSESREPHLLAELIGVDLIRNVLNAHILGERLR